MKPRQITKNINAEPFVEVCCVLLGRYNDGILDANMVWLRQGSGTSVEFNWSEVMQQEEAHGDVVGFYHTHPDGYTDLSERDKNTMQAWAFSFGKPLVCIIETSAGKRGWVFDPQGSIREFDQTETFEGNLVLAAMRNEEHDDK